MRLLVLDTAFEMTRRKKSGYRVEIVEDGMVLNMQRRTQYNIRRLGGDLALRVRFVRATRERAAFLIFNQHPRLHDSSPLDQRIIKFVNQYATDLMVPAPVAVMVTAN